MKTEFTKSFARDLRVRKNDGRFVGFRSSTQPTWLTEKIMHLAFLNNMSEEDEKSLLHVVSAIEAKNKLKSLMADIR